MITKYGTDVLVKSLLLLAIAALIALTFIVSDIARLSVVGTLVIAALLLLNFFRDPERTIPDMRGVVLSPADGKVVLIQDVFEPEFLQQNAVQVSIFMSPLNVHVNRFPISGTVSHFRHIHGEYLVAFNDKSSERNERTHIGIELDGYRILFKQIAGAVARRIVAPLTVGQQARAGERFGMIKFGSRVDVIMPRSSLIKVEVNAKVVAGETIIATYVAEGSARSSESHPATTKEAIV